MKSMKKLAVVLFGAMLLSTAALTGCGPAPVPEPTPSSSAVEELTPMERYIASDVFQAEIRSLKDSFQTADIEDITVRGKDSTLILEFILDKDVSEDNLDDLKKGFQKELDTDATAVYVQMAKAIESFGIDKAKVTVRIVTNDGSTTLAERSYTKDSKKLKEKKENQNNSTPGGGTVTNNQNNNQGENNSSAPETPEIMDGEWEKVNPYIDSEWYLGYIDVGGNTQDIETYYSSQGMPTLTCTIYFKDANTAIFYWGSDAPLTASYSYMDGVLILDGNEVTVDANTISYSSGVERLIFVRV